MFVICDLTCQVLQGFPIPWVQLAYKFEWAMNMSVGENHNPREKLLRKQTS